MQRNQREDYGMNNKELIEALKKAQLVGSKDGISKQHEQLAHWVSQVAPLLIDNGEHYTTFMNAAGKVMARVSNEATTENINIMKSTVDSAIIELESKI